MRHIRCGAYLLALGLLLSMALPGQATDLERLGKELGLGGKGGTLLDKGLKTLRALAPIGYAEEKAIGDALAVEAVQRFGRPYQDDSLARYVTLVGRGVASHSDRPAMPYHFAVLHHDAPNAFALLGGYVFITLGLWRHLQTEAELAGVLGHEIAHIAQKHALKTLQRSQAMQGTSELTLTAMDKNPAMFDQVLNLLSTALFESGLDQHLEQEADELGVAYVARLGYNPSAFPRLLRRLAQYESSSRTALFSTHPDPQGRAGRLDETIRRQYGSRPAGQELTERFAAAFTAPAVQGSPAPPGPPASRPGSRKFRLPSTGTSDRPSR